MVMIFSSDQQKLHETSRNFLPKKYMLACAYSPFTEITSLLSFPPLPLWSSFSELSEVLSPRLQSSFCPKIKLNLQLSHCAFFQSTVSWKEELGICSVNASLLAPVGSSLLPFFVHMASSSDTYVALSVSFPSLLGNFPQQEDLITVERVLICGKYRRWRLPIRNGHSCLDHLCLYNVIMNIHSICHCYQFKCAVQWY